MEIKANVVLFPWGEDHGQVHVYTSRLAGYWERRDGSEGGTLTFGWLITGRLELIDYDGAGVLPNAVVKALRAAGFVLDDTFD